MSSKFTTSVTALAVIAALGTGIAAAQTAPNAAAPEEAQDQSAPAEVTLPQILQGSDFADVETRPGPRGGLWVSGTVAETGKDFEAIVNSEGDLVGARTAEGSALPQGLVDALMPEQARGNAIVAEIAELNGIGTRGGAVMISGQDASGDKVRIGFSADGELMHFGRGDGDRMGPRGGMHRDFGDKDRGGDMKRDGDRRMPHGDMRGPRDGKSHMGEGRGPMKDGDHMSGPRGERPAPGDAPQIDKSALRGSVEAAGYTDLGEARRIRQGLSLEAVNPQGEPVTVIVNRAGEVMRETAR